MTILTLSIIGWILIAASAFLPASVIVLTQHVRNHMATFARQREVTLRIRTAN